MKYSSSLVLIPIRGLSPTLNIGLVPIIAQENFPIPSKAALEEKMKVVLHAGYFSGKNQLSQKSVYQMIYSTCRYHTLPADYKTISGTPRGAKFGSDEYLPRTEAIRLARETVGIKLTYWDKTDDRTTPDAIGWRDNSSYMDGADQPQIDQIIKNSKTSITLEISVYGQKDKIDARNILRRKVIAFLRKDGDHWVVFEVKPNSAEKQNSKTTERDQIKGVESRQSVSSSADSLPSSKEIDTFLGYVLNQWPGRIPEFRDGRPQNDDLILFVLARKLDASFGKRTRVPASEIDRSAQIYFDRTVHHHSIPGWQYKNGLYDSMKDILNEGGEGRGIQVKSLQPLKNGTYSVAVAVDQTSYTVEVRWAKVRTTRRLILTALKKQ